MINYVRNFHLLETSYLMKNLYIPYFPTSRAHSNRLESFPTPFALVLPLPSPSKRSSHLKRTLNWRDD